MVQWSTCIYLVIIVEFQLVVISGHQPFSKRFAVLSKEVIEAGAFVCEIGLGSTLPSRGFAGFCVDRVRLFRRIGFVHKIQDEIIVETNKALRSFYPFPAIMALPNYIN